MDEPAALTERIIERFGGIRPMAAKLEMPVTTVQGWKKRGIIPQARHADIMKVATRENITIDPAELAETDPGATARIESRLADPVIDPVIEATMAEPVHTARRDSGGRLAAIALGISVLTLLAAAGGGVAVSKLRLEPLQARLAGLEAQIEAAGDKTRMDDLAGRVSKLEADLARYGGSQAQGSAGLENRVAALEQQLTAINGTNSDAEQLIKRLSELQVAAGGRELLVQSIHDIQSSTAATQGEVERLRSQLEALNPRLDRVDAALAERRQLGLRAEAIVLAVEQLRTSLRQDKPFAQDLAAVRALASGDSEMLAILDQLQPYADEGVPTADDLEKDLSRLAPEIVRSAVVGDGQSWWRQALYQVSTVISVRRIGKTSQGDQADAVVARAQGELDGDDLRGAVSTLRVLTGLPGQVAAPWLHDAQARIAVEAAEAEMSRVALERLAVGNPPVTTAAPGVDQ